MKRLIVMVTALAAFGADTHANRRAPGFSLPDSSFKRYDLQDYRGRWVLIDFMLTNCPHCKELAAKLEQVKRANPKVAILEVVLPPDTAATVAAYIKENHITVPVLFDQGQMAASYFDARPDRAAFDTPHLFVVDPKGMIVHDYTHDELPDLNKLIAQVIH